MTQVFLSKYVNNIDKKGRVSVPAGYRIALSGQTGIIAYPSIKHPCIEACGTDRLETLSKIIQNLDPYSEERDAFETVILGESSWLSLDSEGRIIIPKSLMDYANLSNQVCFIGKGLVFEIWNPEAAEEHLAKARLIAQNNRNLLKNA